MPDFDDDEKEYLFGFGSIINSSTHASWLAASKESKVEALPGAVATLKSSFGYQRRWNFRSTTGFTALGLCPIDQNGTQDGSSSGINGVVFQIKKSMVCDFDRREVGYQRLSIPLECLQFHTSCKKQAAFQFNGDEKIWIYVPSPSQCLHADENHPLLQSYVDTVLQGCLEWGGESMVEDFILMTGGWSTFFLNDTPSSRRPWLFRKEYDTIDRLLQKYAEKTHYADRRHPEEFASAMMKLRMKGTWSIPRRNPNFTGRDKELKELEYRLATQDSGRQRVQVVEIAGMGGVGKTQLVTEYCYRHFPSLYGLVVWLNAESSEALVTDYKQLLADLIVDADSNPNKDTNEIVAEVKTRLFRSQIPWLLVFDNLEDKKLLENFMPNGAGKKGHIVATTRPNESIELLRRAAGPQNMNGDSNAEAAKYISDTLGHLPLALGMAAAYMNRCDVTCLEYRERYSMSEENGQSLLRHGKLQDYSLTVASSLSLSLTAIQKESVVAGDLLKLLCFLGPDQITKLLLRHLLRWKQKTEEEPEPDSNARTSFVAAFSGLLACGILLATSTLAKDSRHSSALIAAATLSAAAGLAMNDSRARVDSKMNDIMAHPSIHMTPEVSSSDFSAFEYEQADLVWDILKSFSLVSVKEGKGNMHRLLAQALRSTQPERERRSCLKICVNMMRSIWKFQPEKIESWSDSLQILDHVKAVVYHSLDHGLESIYLLKAARLSTQVAMLSSMALNAFIEAQASLELSIKLLDISSEADTPIFQKARAQALHELGRVLRYEGKYTESEQSLLSSLRIYEELNAREQLYSEGLAATLHELGVLEVKKHNLDSAASFLEKSLDMKRNSSTLHQLAAIHVARKPSDLKAAKALLKEALGLSRHIGQRAATLKQLARVTIRQGLLDNAEMYLEQALELYLEVYGENKNHMNVAAVKFQQGALAIQREQFEQAWLHFSECLRIRRYVYAYARPAGSTEKNPTHLEVSCVLHELGRVAFAQGRFETATETMKSERSILERLAETASRSERVFQARLTNITWLHKCAKRMGHEDDMNKLMSERTRMKNARKKDLSEPYGASRSISLVFQNKALECRALARRFALQKEEGNIANKQELLDLLMDLSEGMGNDSSGPMKHPVEEFHAELLRWIHEPHRDRRQPILKACDDLR
eukprot:scaffold22586_cov138-Cylindrotheca_fusiformis.AAC.40